MTIADLVLLLTVVAAVVALPRVAYLLACGRWRAARRTALGLGVVLVLYAAVLVVVSLVSPQRVLALHEDRCFDDWCLAVERVAHPRAIGAVRARGRFYLVTVQVSSRVWRPGSVAYGGQKRHNAVGGSRSPSSRERICTDAAQSI